MYWYVQWEIQEEWFWNHHLFMHLTTNRKTYSVIHCPVGRQDWWATQFCLRHQRVWNTEHSGTRDIIGKRSFMINLRVWWIENVLQRISCNFASELWSAGFYVWDRWHHPTRRDALWYFILFSSFGISRGYPNLVRVPGRISIIHHRHYWIWAD